MAIVNDSLTSTLSMIDCDITSFISAYNIIGYIQIIGSAVLLFFLAAEVFIIPLSLICILLIRKWHNPAKFYYYTISISNAIAFIFTDIIFGFFNLATYITQIVWPTNNIFSKILYRYILPHPIICPLLNFLNDIGPVFEFWSTAIFSTHRMLVVLFPLKTTKINKLFNKWTLLIILVLVGCPYIPDLFTDQYTVILGIYNLCILPYTGFWFAYSSQITYLKYIIPLLLITASTITIVVKLKLLSFQRSHLISHDLRINRTEVKTIINLVVIGVIYIIGTVPFASVYIATEFLNSECILLLNAAEMLYEFFIYVAIIIRVSEEAIFFMMIPEFRQTINNIIHFHLVKI